jgi:hypothetical protein
MFKIRTVSYLPVTADTTSDMYTNLDRPSTEIACSNSTNIISILQCYPLRAYPHSKSANKYLRNYMLHKPRRADTVKYWAHNPQRDQTQRNYSKKSFNNETTFLKNAKYSYTTYNWAVLPDELIQISEKTALIWPSKVCRTFGREAVKGKVKQLCSVKRDTRTPCIYTRFLSHIGSFIQEGMYSRLQKRKRRILESIYLICFLIRCSIFPLPVNLFCATLTQPPTLNKILAHFS